MSYLDHFDGAAIDSRWTQVTGGSGAISLTDSYVKLAAPSVGDAAYLYLTAELDKTRSQLWVMSANIVSDGWRKIFYVRNTSTPQTPLGFTASDTVLLAQLSLNGGNYNLLLEHYNSAGTRRIWNASTQAWANSLASPATIHRGGLDNYLQVGFEFDADGGNSRFRLLAWTVRSTTAGTYVFPQGGPRLVQLTDWVDWSAAQTAQTDLYLFLGPPWNDNAANPDQRIEWLRYEDGTRRHAWVNGKTNDADNYDIKHWWSYGDSFVPQDRDTIAIAPGTAGAWDDVEVRGPFVVKDGSDYRYFYEATDGSNFAIGAATSTDPNAAPTKDAGNPVISPPGGTTDIFFPFVVKDEAEADSNKRWKMLAVVLVAGPLWRIHYLTAPAYNGTWTDQGAVLSEGGGGDPDEDGCTNPVALWTDNHWVVFFTRKRTDGTSGGIIEDVSYATGSDLASLTKSNVTFLTWQANGEEDVTGAVSGRTLTMSDTSGFSADSVVLLDEDTNRANWAISRVRKVNAGDLEIYHRLDGFASGATVVQADRAHGIYFRLVERIGSKWYFWGVIYRYTAHLTTRDAFHESTALWTHQGSRVLEETPALEKLLYPPNAMTHFGHERSSENIAIETLPMSSTMRSLSPAKRAKTYLRM
jgi:hypothetical protein